MEVISIERTITEPTGKGTIVRFLVDSGATYTLLPQTVWKAIESVPKRKLTFTLADGTAVRQKVSECGISLLQGGRAHTCYPEKPAEEALLGAVTLEIYCKVSGLW